MTWTLLRRAGQATGDQCRPWWGAKDRTMHWLKHETRGIAVGLWQRPKGKKPSWHLEDRDIDPRDLQGWTYMEPVVDRSR